MGSQLSNNKAGYGRDGLRTTRLATAEMYCDQQGWLRQRCTAIIVDGSTIIAAQTCYGEDVTSPARFGIVFSLLLEFIIKEIIINLLM